VLPLIIFLAVKWVIVQLIREEEALK